MRYSTSLRRLTLAAGTLLAVARPQTANAQSLLLIPDISTTTGRRVLAFNPQDGSLVNANFIPNDGRLRSPKEALDSGHGTILVSDQVANAIFEYSYSGTYLRTVADQTSSGIQNLRGLAVLNGNIYVTVGGGTLSNTVQEFAYSGASLGTWTASHLNSPFDITFRNGDALISNSGTNTVERYDLSGNWLNTLVSGGIKFPQQINEEANSNLLVGGFSPPAGIYEYDATGHQVGLYNASGIGPRAAYELGNGKVLFTDGSSVRVYDRSNNVITTSFSGGNFNYIDLITAVPEPGSTALLASGVLGFAGFVVRRRRRK